MQCRNNNDDHNNSCDQRNQRIIILGIHHEGKSFTSNIPTFIKTKNFFFNTNDKMTITNQIVSEKLIQ